MAELVKRLREVISPPAIAPAMRTPSSPDLPSPPYRPPSEPPSTPSAEPT